MKRVLLILSLLSGATALASDANLPRPKLSDLDMAEPYEGLTPRQLDLVQKMEETLRKRTPEEWRTYINAKLGRFRTRRHQFHT